MDDKGEKLGIKSVEVAGRLLTAMIQAGRPAALKDLAHMAGMSPGKAHRYLVSLVRLQLVAQEPASGHYHIGPMAIALGLSGMRSLNVVRTATELMPTLRNEIDETVMLLIWGRSGPIVYGFEESSRPVFMNVRVGSILPMLTTAAGLLFAAYLPEDQTREIVEAERAKVAAGGTARPSATDWAMRVEQVRETGLARSVGEFLPGVNAVAAPIFDHKGRIAAVIGALGRSEEIDVDLDGAVAAAVRSTAREASWRLGHIEDTAEIPLPSAVD